MIEPKQELMSYLYGHDTLSKIKERLAYLDDSLNEIVEKIAYEYFWCRDGISLQEKSLVTLATLVSTKKIEQIHLQAHCFLNTGWSSKAFSQLLDGLKPFLTTEYKNEVEHIFSFVSEGKLDFGKTEDTSMKLIGEDDLLLAKLAASIATQEHLFINKYLMESLNKGLEEKIRNTFIHLIVYCGFPAVVNGFSVLMECIEKRDIKKKSENAVL